MWLHFFMACALSLVVLYLPGLPCLISSGFSLIWSLCLAPIFSVATYAVLAIVFPLFGVSASFNTLFFPVLCFSAVLLLIRFVFDKSKNERALTALKTSDISTAVVPLLYAVVGVLIGTVFFVKNLDTAASFFQAFDNGHHLNSIRSFLDSSNYSSFNGQFYVESLGSLATPYLSSTSSFYPSAWHGLVAVVVNALDIPITVGVNAVNTVLLCVVFPLGVYCLLDVLFSHKRECLVLGAFLAVAFTNSVWDFVAFGPLYPMLLSYSLVPGAIACFIGGLRENVSLAKRAGLLCTFGVGCLGIALSQPSGIFLMGMILAPYCVSRAGEVAVDKRGLAFAKTIRCVTALIIVAFWCFCYRLPFFSGVVAFNWPKTCTLFQSVIDVLFFSTTSNPAQMGLAFLVFLGVLSAIKDKKRSWIVASYVLVSSAYILSVATEGTPKHVMGGFWYTDPHRLAANIAIVAIPLAVMGCARLYELANSHWLTEIIESRCSISCSGIRRIIYFATGILLVLIYIPSFAIRGFASIDTSFGYYGETIQSENDFQSDHVLTKEEIDFSQEALSMIPEGAGIINSPNDGSAFLYALDGANILYRYFDLPSLEDEKQSSVIVREKLNTLASNDEVKAAVKDLGASYLLVLDQGKKPEETSHFWSYFPDQWLGIETVNDCTPGFTVVLAKDDMRLYRIDL